MEDGGSDLGGTNLDTFGMKVSMPQALHNMLVIFIGSDILIPNHFV